MSENEDILRRLSKIEEKLDTFQERLFSQHLCSAPNSCITLKERMDKHETLVEHVMHRIERLEKWQSYIMGIGAVLILLITFFGPWLRARMGL